ncbi:MAG: RagB/SusD family nutrient uptake outer membrane protein [Paludibacteraceae bacterium]|nr:RagB/SusD family nutrient uptake outer membrane protein [Paludibacteraceae bacterium]
MKAIKYTVLAMTALLGFSSCSDFLDNDSPSAMDDKNVFTRSNLTEQTIAGIYNLFGEDKSFRNRLCGGYVSVNTDIEYCNKSNGAAVYANYTITANGPSELTTANKKDPWSYLSSGIERANVAINGIRNYSDLNDPTFRYFLGEALTLRAFCYLEMTNLWGDVPATFSPLNVDDVNSIYAPKQDRNVIFEQLRADLKEAADLVPWSEEITLNAAKNNTGRINKAFILGLLARVDLMYAGKALRPDTWIQGGGASYSVQYNIKDQAARTALYKEALDACAQVINKYGTGKLESSYEDIWKKLCQDNATFSATEVLFAIPFASARGQVVNLNGIKYNALGSFLHAVGDARSNAMVTIVPTLAFDFDKNDTRKWVTIVPFSWNLADADIKEDLDPLGVGTIATSADIVAKTSRSTQMYLGKYRYEWMSRDVSTSDDGVDLPIMRYSDILLMFAEASIGGIDGVAPENTSGLSGQSMFDAVRARAGVPSKPLTIENIQQERAFEFAGERIRKYDLIRWGIFDTKLKETMNRLADLDAATGEFAGRNEKVYFKYKKNANADNYSLKGGQTYSIDQIYGMSMDEIDVPAGYVSSTENGGWLGKKFYASDESGSYLTPNKYWLYGNGTANPDDPNSKTAFDAGLLANRQFWPIFMNNINSSNGSLWNDYGY